MWPSSFRGRIAQCSLALIARVAAVMMLMQVPGALRITRVASVRAPPRLYRLDKAAASIRLDRRGHRREPRLMGGYCRGGSGQKTGVCRPLMAFAPTINFGNGHEAHSIESLSESTASPPHGKRTRCRGCRAGRVLTRFTTDRSTRIGWSHRSRTSSCSLPCRPKRS